VWINHIATEHNARFAKPARLEESAFVAADPALLAETLCIEEERVVARDNTVTYDSRRLQLPASRVTPCSPPSRRGLPRTELAAPTERRPSLTASARGVTQPGQVGTKKRPSDRTKQPTRKTRMVSATPASA
jgi:hypothetical protein